MWSDRGADIFQAVASEGLAIVQHYTVGEDFVRGTLEVASLSLIRACPTALEMSRCCYS